MATQFAFQVYSVRASTDSTGMSIRERMCPVGQAVYVLDRHCADSCGKINLAFEQRRLWIPGRAQMRGLAKTRICDPRSVKPLKPAMTSKFKEDL